MVGNVFAGADASTEAVQIKTGPLTDPRSIFVENNRTSNPEVLVPALPWQFHAATEPGFDFSGEGWWEEQDYPGKRHATHDRDAAVTYSFYGSRVSHTRGLLQGKRKYTTLVDCKHGCKLRVSG